MTAATQNLYRTNLIEHVDSSNSNQQPLHLPKIIHPSTRTAPVDPKSLNLTARAVSRASSLGDMADMYIRKPNDASDTMFARSKKFNSYDEYNYNIPEGIKAVYTPDINKVSMPIFGSRPGSSASMTNLKQGPSIEEYHHLLREKVKSNLHEIRTKFRNADQDGRGGVSKEAFAHILASILGPSKPLSPQHFSKLIEKFGLKNRPIIKFEEFTSCLLENKTEFSDWIDPVRSTSTFNQPVNRKATQVFVILKEKANLRTSDMVNLIPSLVGGSQNKIFRPELLNTINGMGIKMEPEEFDKLWKKFDPENSGFVKSELLLKRLGLTNERSENLDSSMSASLSELFKSDDDASSIGIPIANVQENFPVNKYTVKKSTKKQQNSIERWLKKRFREGFSKIKTSFEDVDLQKTGQVRRDQFLNILRQNGFKLDSNLLDAFLERCEISVPKNSSLIPYQEFLEKFQNRSDRGLAYRFIAEGDFDDRAHSAIGQVERKLLKLFQNDFLGLLQVFRKIDRNKSNSISKQEFRAALESNFGIELTDQEFEELLKDVPRDGSNRIKYLEFMTRFDSDSASSLFDSQSYMYEDFQPRKAKREYDPIIEENEDIDSPREIRNYHGRSSKQLNEIIKNQVKNHYKELENAWSEVDIQNSNEMNKDMMWELFKKLKIAPPITREEIEFLWNEFILKDNKKLEYWQFVRHFGYSKKSAAYQNSKRAPPKRGDNDMMLTSNKLGRDSILIRGSVQSKLILQFDVLKRTFQEIDPYYTNFLLRDEFEEILKDLCPELNQQEMEYICSKHENPADGRINYMEFLHPYAPKRNREKPSDSLKRVEDLPSSRLDMNDPLIIKLRIKLSDSYKDLRRIFKQHDSRQSGFVNISDFKEALKQNRVFLTEDEHFNLLRRLDKDVTGMINYNKFINEFIKP